MYKINIRTLCKEVSRSQAFLKAHITHQESGEQRLLMESEWRHMMESDQRHIALMGVVIKDMGYMGCAVQSEMTKVSK